MYRFVALFLGAGQQRLERFDGGARFKLCLRHPLRMRGRLAGLHLHGQLVNQVLLTLLGLGMGGLFLLLCFKIHARLGVTNA